MEAGPAPTITSSVGGGGPRGGGFRGRGGGPMRGGFERGRGRGMGRGHFMGGMGRGMGGAPPPQGMMPGGPRGMRPRGAPGGFQSRGGFQPRGAPMGMRGGRPPIYQQPPKQHSGADNNKTVSPVPVAGSGEQQTTEATAEESTVATSTSSTVATASNTTVASTTNTQVAGSTPTNGTPSAAPYVRAPRGRGGSFSRGGGRGGYNPHMNGGSGMYGGPHHSGGPGVDHGHMPRRGAPRGRGGYGQGMTRPAMHQPHNVNQQIAPVPAIKRGAPGGPGPKRGRYETGPYSQRPMAPKYHAAPQHIGAVPPQANYGPPASHHPPAQSHHGYPPHDPSQQVDPYAQSGYNAAAAQSAYNGYTQNTGYVSHTSQATAPASSAYATHHGIEYDQNQYQNYNSTSYPTQDTRYQNYGQDYTQQYGAAALDYNTTAPTDYAQHGQQAAAYDERAYAGYDTQSYQQSYSNATAYY